MSTTPPTLPIQPGQRGVRRQLAQTLRDWIRQQQFGPGDQIPPLRQIARKFGVAKNTARSAVDQLKAEGLLDGRRGSGTYVTDAAEAASGLAPSGQAARQTRWAALIMNAGEHVFGELGRHFTEGVAARGERTCQLGSRQGRATVERLVRGWADDPPYAVIVHAGWRELIDAIRVSCAGRSVLVTVPDRNVFTRDWHRVGPDYEAMYGQIAQRLVQQGHRRVGLVTHARRTAQGRPDTRRKQDVGHTTHIRALGHALRAHDPGARLSVHYHRGEPTDKRLRDGLSPERIERLARSLDRPDRPTALVGDDFRMVAATRAAERLGLRVPEDLTLIGIGNTPWSHAFGFPTVSMEEETMAQRILELVQRGPSGFDGTRYHIETPVRLVER